MHSKYAILLFLLTIALFTDAEVVLDGTTGAAGSLTGPHFLIDARLGQQVGGNLFHSFERFNLGRTESATFTGPASINNLISRVTGGQVSYIDGLLRSTMPQADMYFLNPAGVMFGPNAKIDVPASLYVSSADYLKLGDTGRFDVTTPGNTLLTVAPPSAFGFLNQSPARISVEGSQLVLRNENKFARGVAFSPDTLALVGGDLSIKDAQLITYGNDAYLVSVASAGEAPVEPKDFTDNRFAAYGTLSLTDATTDRYYGNVDTSGPGGGAVFIRAGRFISESGWVFADTRGDKPGRGVTIHANEFVDLKKASLVTTQVYADGAFFTEATGAAGHIAITAGDIRLTGGSQLVGTSESVGRAGNITLSAQQNFLMSGSDSSTGPSSVLSDSYSSGNAGEIVISADQLKMDAGTQMRTSTPGGLGDAGSISLKVRALEMRGGAQIAVGVGSQDNAKGTGGKGGTLNVEASEAVLINGEKSGLFGNVFTLSGQGGMIKLNAPAVTIEKGGRIQTETLSDGHAGHIVLNVDTLTLSDGGVISTSTLKGSGEGGRVEIVANQAVLIKGESAAITSNTGGSGSGGAIEVSAPIVTITTGGSIQAVTAHDGTGITGGSGTGGLLKIQARQLQLTEKGRIITNSFGEGDAGSIALILAETLQVRGGSGIMASSLGSGQGGNVEIQARQFQLTEKGYIITNSLGEGDAGSLVLILAETLQVRGGSVMMASSLGSGQGGNLEIQARQFKLTERSGISASSVGQGNAGNLVLVLGETLQVRGGSEIMASSLGSGQGGNVEIQARQLELTEGGGISASSVGQGNAGNIVLVLGETLQMQDGSIRTSATSADGGNIKITVPNYFYLIDSEITTSVGSGEGGGGNMTLQPEFIVLDGSQIIAQAYGGPGGNINIATTGIYNFTGERVKEVINASSKYGVDGIVVVNSPDKNVFEDIVILPAAFFDASTLLENPCEAVGESQLEVIPYAGRRSSPSDWKASNLPRRFNKPAQTSRAKGRQTGGYVEKTPGKLSVKPVIMLASGCKREGKVANQDVVPPQLF
jgi:filamentous hemagglutinin family protein